MITVVPHVRMHVCCVCTCVCVYVCCVCTCVRECMCTCVRVYVCCVRTSADSWGDVLSAYPAMLHTIKFIVLVFFLSHISGCIFNLIALTEVFPSSLSESAPLVDSSTAHRLPVGTKRTYVASDARACPCRYRCDADVRMCVPAALGQLAQTLPDGSFDMNSWIRRFDPSIESPHDAPFSRYSAVQYSTVSTVHTVHYNAIHYSAAQYSTVQYSAVQYSTVSTVQYSTVHYSAVQYSTVHVQCITVGQSVSLCPCLCCRLWACAALLAVLHCVCFAFCVCVYVCMRV